VDKELIAWSFIAIMMVFAFVLPKGAFLKYGLYVILVSIFYLGYKNYQNNSD
jgi:hypothetical protein